MTLRTRVMKYCNDCVPFGVCKLHVHERLSTLRGEQCSSQVLDVIHLDFSPALNGKHYGEAGFLSNVRTNNNPLKTSSEVKIKWELNWCKIANQTWPCAGMFGLTPLQSCIVPLQPVKTSVSLLMPTYGPLKPTQVTWNLENHFRQDIIDNGANKSRVSFHKKKQLKNTSWRSNFS